MGYITSADWTLTKERTPLSPRSNSCITSPYSTFDMPAQPYPLRLAPKRPISPIGLTNSRGKRPSRLHSSMMGTRLSSMNLRVLSRTRRSSSESSESNSMKLTPLNLKGGIRISLGAAVGGSNADEIGVLGKQIRVTDSRTCHPEALCWPKDLPRWFRLERRFPVAGTCSLF